MCKYLQAIFYFFSSVFLCSKHTSPPPIGLNKGLSVPPCTVALAELPVADNGNHRQLSGAVGNFSAYRTFPSATTFDASL